MVVKMADSKVFKSVLWKTLERGGSQVVFFIFSILIARILSPETFGIISITNFFINIINVLIQNGINVAIIRKKTLNDSDYSTTFFITLIFALISIFIIFIFSDKIASYYSISILSNLIRFSSISLVINAYNSIQNVFIVKNYLFKQHFASSFTSVIISGLIGLVLAMNGLGVWALAIQQLLNQILVTLFLSYFINWWPKFKFSLSSFRETLNFCIFYIPSILMDALFKDLYILIIGKYYSTNLLGLFSRGQQFPNLVINNTNAILSAILLPIYSELQDDIYSLKKRVRQATQITTFISVPLLVGLTIIAKPMVEIILTSKWIDSTSYIILLSLGSLFLPIQNIYIQAMISNGKSKVYLKSEILKKVIFVAILFISIPYGLRNIAIGMILSSYLSFLVNAYYIKKVVSYTYIEQISDIFPPLFSSLIMYLITYNLRSYFSSIISLILAQIIVASITYFILGKLTKNKSLEYLLSNLIRILS